MFNHSASEKILNKSYKFMKYLFTLFLVCSMSISSFATTYLVQTGKSGDAAWSGVTGTVVNLSELGQSVNQWYNTTVADGDQIWLASGTYQLTDSILTVGTEQIYGGFAGTETTVESRAKVADGKAWEFSNPTVIFGGTNSEGSLVRGITVLTAALIDGLTVDSCGVTTKARYTAGGVYLAHSGAIMRNSVVRNCLSQGDNAAGLYIVNGAKLLDSYVHSCQNTTKTGGGVQVNGIGTVSGCLIENNTSRSTGAGLYLNGVHTEAGTIITNNTITGNASAAAGGGIGTYSP